MFGFGSKNVLIKRLQREVDNHSSRQAVWLEEKATLRGERDGFEVQLKRAKTELGKLKAERNELKAKVRDQVQADLLLNALQAIGLVPDHLPENFDKYRDKSEALRDALYRLDQVRANHGGLDNYLGGQSLGGSLLGSAL